MIGGISYFHAYAYDLLATNERIMAASCDAAIEAHRRGQAAEGHLPELVDGVRVDRPLAVASRATSARSRRRCRRTASRSWPSSTSPGPRGTSTSCRTRSSGRSTASASARAGRSATSRSLSGNVKLAMSHVVPDLVQKVAQGPGPAAHPRRRQPDPALHLRRRPGPRASSTAMEHPDGAATTTSTSRPRESTTVLELAELIWRKIKGPDVPLPLRARRPVRARRAAAGARRSRRPREVLGFEATTSLDEMLDEVIPWIDQAVKDGTI